MLFRSWNSSLNRTLTKDEVAELDRTIGVWRNTAVIPLREIRRALKTPPAMLTPDVAETFRNRIKTAELEAERLQQEAMYALAQSGRFLGSAPTPVEAARASLTSYQAILRPFPPQPLEVVLTAFAKNAGNG